MKSLPHTTVLPAHEILCIACTESPLPVSFTPLGKPEYVPDWVVAIFPANLITTAGTHHHRVIVGFAHRLGETFARIAQEYAARLAQEAHDLERFDEQAAALEVADII